MDKTTLKCYAVTDRSWLKGESLANVVQQILDGGATFMQLREKHLSQEDMLAEGRELKALCQKYGVPLVINDDVEVARQLGVGVHVGQDDASMETARAMLGPDAIIGVSCQTVAQALAAEKAGADYLGVGAVFSTSTKLDAVQVDARELAAICAAVTIPVVAIGGIVLHNVEKLGGSGICGVAVVSALFAAPNPRQATADMLAAVNRMLAVPAPRQKGAIIDLDGTILDSFPYWDTLAADYLATKGKTAEDGLLNILDSMEVPEAARYLKEHYALEEDPKTIAKELFDAIRHVYVEKATLFPGAAEKLAKLHADGVRLMLFTAAERSAAEACLRRNGVLQAFDGIVSTVDLTVDKSVPNGYWHVLGRLGTALDSTVIYEDAPYAVAGARKSGMAVIERFI